MPTFTYQGRDEGGRLIKGVLEAESRVVLADRLRKMGCVVTRIQEGAVSLRGAARVRLGEGVSPEQFLLVVVELANLVEAGIPLVSSLGSVAAQCRPGALRDALEAATKDIEGGKPFSQALSRHPRIFPGLMVSMAAVGESSGKLDVVLQRYAGFVEKDLSLKKTVQGALTYPVFLFFMSVGLVLFVVSFVVPQFAALFARAGLVLPGPTRLVAGAGGILQRHGGLLVFLALSAFAAAGRLLRRPAVRQQVDGILLQLPGVGPVIHQTVVARVSRCLATLVASGIPILTALETTAGVTGNEAVSRELVRVRSAVERGEKIFMALSVGKVFRPDVVQMIRAGEESGRLDVMLDKIADFYELRVGFALKQMTTLIEPVLLVGMGIVVAFIMASLLLPMFDMVRVLQKGGIR